MKRQKKPQARSRILDDDEIRAVWEAADTSGTYGNIVKLLLLTGQRRDKVFVTMRWADIRDGGMGIQEVHERAKGTAGSLVLPAVALSNHLTGPH